MTVGKTIIRDRGGGIKEEAMSKADKTQAVFVAGLVVLVFGVILILMWWPDVVSFFRGFLGIVVSIAGLLMMYSLKK